MKKVVLVHGFTQTAESWDAVALHLDGCDVLRARVPGHEGWPVIGDFDESALRLGSYGEGAYAGYSMGGRLALRFAMLRPELVKSLILISSSPGIEDEDERAARRVEDEALAIRLEEIGVRAFIDEWTTRPMFRTVAHLDHSDRYGHNTAGLAASLRILGLGSMQSLWDELRSVQIPVTLVAGELDTKFVGVAREMQMRLSNAELVVLPGCGHSVPLEKPDELAWIIKGVS